MFTSTDHCMYLVQILPLPVPNVLYEAPSLAFLLACMKPSKASRLRVEQITTSTKQSRTSHLTCINDRDPLLFFELSPCIVRRTTARGSCSANS